MQKWLLHAFMILQRSGLSSAFHAGGDPQQLSAYMVRPRPFIPPSLHAMQSSESFCATLELHGSPFKCDSDAGGAQGGHAEPCAKAGLVSPDCGPEEAAA